MSYSTGTIDCSGLLQHCTLYCDLQEDTHVITLGDARFLGSVLCFFAARLHGGGAGCMEVLGF